MLRALREAAEGALLVRATARGWRRCWRRPALQAGVVAAGVVWDLGGCGCLLRRAARRRRSCSRGWT